MDTVWTVTANFEDNRILAICRSETAALNWRRQACQVAATYRRSQGWPRLSGTGEYAIDYIVTERNFD